MHTDFVVDTNVLMHADNDQEPSQQYCIKLINRLINSTDKLCMDQGFNLVEASNKSLIGYEYIKHLRIGMLGYTLILKLLSDNRIDFLSIKIPPSVSKKINQCISNKKPRDKTFLKVTFNSISKIFVTHDQEDFNYSKRGHIRNTFGIKVIDACDVA